MLSSELTELRRVFETEKPFHDWPECFELALASPLVLALLRTYARHPEAMRSRRLPVTRNWHLGLHPVPTQAPTAAPARPPVVDRKRLAANDKDD